MSRVLHILKRVNPTSFSLLTSDEVRQALVLILISLSLLYVAGLHTAYVSSPVLQPYRVLLFLLFHSDWVFRRIEH